MDDYVFCFQESVSLEAVRRWLDDLFHSKPLTTSRVWKRPKTRLLAAARKEGVKRHHTTAPSPLRHAVLLCCQ